MEKIYEYTNIYFKHLNVSLYFGKRDANSAFIMMLNRKIATLAEEEDDTEENYIVVNSTNPIYNEHKVIHISKKKAEEFYKIFEPSGKIIK